MAYCNRKSKLVLRTLSLSDLRKSLLVGAKTSAVIYLLLGTSNVVAWILVRNQAPKVVAQWSLDFTTSAEVFMLVAIGVLISKGGLNFWPIWIAGSIGAALGDWLSYWVGVKLGPPVAQIWPLSRHPELIPKGERFVTKWGVLAIFIGRCCGPLRASVPLVAGIFRMPYVRFQLANFSSAFVWAAVLLTLGDVIARAIEWVRG